MRPITVHAGIFDARSTNPGSGEGSTTIANILLGMAADIAIPGYLACNACNELALEVSPVLRKAASASTTPISCTWGPCANDEGAPGRRVRRRYVDV